MQVASSLRSSQVDARIMSVESGTKVYKPFTFDHSRLITYYITLITMSIGKEYLQTVIRRVKYYKELGDKTFEQLNSDAEFHYQPNEESNSIAVIIQHVAGNMLSR